jgi:tripartite-type tricarboxylate transporter receptor subunit TctC
VSKLFMAAMAVLWVVASACTPGGRSAGAPRGDQASGPPAQAYDERAVADFYRGKTIRIIVGFTAAGAFDFYSRLLANHMSQYIPGNPTIIVENRPGAGSALAANLVYAVEPKDGTVIGSFNEFLVLQQLLGAEGIQFDAAKFNWLGSSVDTTSTCLVRSDSGINSIQELMGGREVVVGATSPGTPTYDTPATMNAALGTRFRMVTGYEGITQINLAMESREVDGYCVSLDAVQIVARRLVEADPPAVKILSAMGSQPSEHPYLRNVPVTEPLARTEREKQLLRAVHAPSRISKPFAVAPEVPRDRVEALRRAMVAVFADPAFIEETRAANQERSPSEGEKVTAVVQELLQTPAETVAELKNILK